MDSDDVDQIIEREMNFRAMRDIEGREKESIDSSRKTFDKYSNIGQYIGAATGALLGMYFVGNTVNDAFEISDSLGRIGVWAGIGTLSGYAGYYAGIIGGAVVAGVVNNISERRKSKDISSKVN